MIKRRRTKRRKKKAEFTKGIIASVLLTYFFGVGVGAFVVVKLSPEQLYAYLTFIGAPTATAIGFYCWKAKNENIHKNPDITADPSEGGGLDPAETQNNEEG